MNNQNLQRQRNLYLSQEFNIAIFLFKSGLELLQQDGLYQRKTFATLILITSGLERLMKIILYLHTLEQTSQHLTKNQFKSLGHDLENLCDKIITSCFVSPYTNSPSAQNDLDFLRSVHINKMFQLLSKFAKASRYVYMDAVADPANFTQSPEMLWEEFGISITDTEVTVNKQDERAKEINQSCVIYFEKVLRALSRLFVFGVLGNEGKKHGIKLYEFSSMADNKLGKTRYNPYVGVYN